MRILSITAGAAGMYCGSCFRDNALAAEILRRGHDVSLVPMYTPSRTDEANVSQRRVIFGGISVYLQQQLALFRRTPRLLDRLWDSPRVISALAGRGVSTDATLLGGLTVSMLDGERGVLRKEFDKLADWIRDEPAPDVINLPNSLLISLAEPLRRLTGRPICCTLQGEELFINGLAAPYRDQVLASIRARVRHVDRFVAVSDYCARFMGEWLQIPPAKMSTVPLGINLQGYEAAGPRSDSTFRVGYFARIAPEKGLHVLAEAYIRLRSSMQGAPARLVAAGYMPPGPSPYLDRVRQTLAAAGLESEFWYEGEVDRAGKIAFLKSLDVMSVPATYDEPKGIFLLEAMACGVPVLQPHRGGFTEIVEKTGGGLLIPPDDVEALAGGLQQLWAGPGLRQELAARAFAGVRAHYGIGASADRMLSVYQDVVEAAAASAVASRS